MGDANPIHTIGDYSKPSHEGYRNTIELPIGNNAVPLRSDTIQLVQNGWSFHELWSDDLNQHLKYFLKLVDSLDLDGENRERTRLCLFQFSLCDQASNWLERLLAGSITTWEDLTNRFLAQFFPLGRTAKLRNDILIEEAKSLVTKNANSISLARREEERNNDNDVATSVNIEKPTRIETGMSVNEAENGIKNEAIRKAEKEETTEAPISQPITRKEDIRGNFEIPCNIGGLKYMNALVDQGSNVNVMPIYTYIKLTDERPTETDIRLFLASHSYIYPLGIAEDILVEVAEHVYLVDFMILDIKENEKRPFILGTSFLTMAKAVIKFDKDTITLRSGKSKISFNRIPESLCKDEKWIKNDIEPISPTMTVNRLVGMGGKVKTSLRKGDKV
ncbi:zinc finger, CCHC-type containing protein [Tanacetum coccineum]